MSAGFLLPGQQVKGTVTALDRRTNSVNGNARWRIRLSDGRSWNTKTDCHVGLVLGQSWVGEPVTLVIDGRGQVIAAERTASVTP